MCLLFLLFFVALHFNKSQLKLKRNLILTFTQTHHFTLSPSCASLYVYKQGNTKKANYIWHEWTSVWIQGTRTIQQRTFKCICVSGAFYHLKPSARKGFFLKQKKIETEIEKKRDDTAEYRSEWAWWHVMWLHGDGFRKWNK